MATDVREEVVVAGHICLDMIPRFEGGETDLDAILVPGKLNSVGPLLTATGGTVSNTGLALHRLGFPARLRGKIGDDVVGRAILDILRSYSPRLVEDMIVAEGQASSYTVVISPPGVDRIFLHCPGANDTFCAGDVDYEGLAAARLFHFGYPPLMRRMFIDEGAELVSLLSGVKKRGATTSLDMARPDPASEAGGVNWRRLLERVLPHVDLFLPSFDETLYMLDREGFDRLERESDSGDLNALAHGPLLRDLADRSAARHGRGDRAPQARRPGALPSHDVGGGQARRQPRLWARRCCCLARPRAGRPLLPGRCRGHHRGRRLHHRRLPRWNPGGNAAGGCDGLRCGGGRVQR